MRRGFQTPAAVALAAAESMGALLTSGRHPKMVSGHEYARKKARRKMARASKKGNRHA